MSPAALPNPARSRGGGRGTQDSSLPSPAAPGIAPGPSIPGAFPAVRQVWRVQPHLCARCRMWGHSCQAGFLAKLLARLCVWINYEICMSFTELQSNQSTLSGGELERGSALDCSKPRASTGLLNLSPWAPKRPVSSGCGGRYLLVSSGKPSRGPFPTPPSPGEWRSSGYLPWGTYSPRKCHSSTSWQCHPFHRAA